MELELQEQLKAEIEKITSDMHLKNPNPMQGGTYKKLSVFIQDLPIPEGKDEEDEDETISQAPYVIVEVYDSSGGEGKSSISVIFVIGIYDDDKTKSGYKDCIRIKNRIVERFATNPLLGKFEAEKEWTWQISDEDNHPYYFAGLKMTFLAPAFLRINNQI